MGLVLNTNRDKPLTDLHMAITLFLHTVVLPQGEYGKEATLEFCSKSVKRQEIEHNMNFEMLYL